MSRVLVAYTSKNGATVEIAEAIADQLRRARHTAGCKAADQVRSLESYDAAELAAERALGTGATAS